MTKKDFVDWKQNPVTTDFFKQIQYRITGLKDELASSAGINPRDDAWRAGGIQAFQDVLDSDWFEETEE